MFDLISIVIPIYKVEKYLDKCVNSILTQTYSNLEIFLVDDGSPDNCGKMCDDYARKDSRIKVIHKANGGLADARNVAIDAATGEWIICVDSDDFVESDYVESLYNLVKKYNSLIACSRFRYVYEDKVNQHIEEPYFEAVYDKWIALKSLFLQQEIHTGAWGKIYHRSLFASGVRYPYGLIYEDLPTTYLLMLQSEKIAYCNKRTYNYLLRPTSLEGSSFNPKKSKSAVKIIESIQSHFKELTPILPAVKSRLFSLASHVLLAMPNGYEGDDKNFLLDYIKKHRFAIIFGLSIRFKARIMAISSFFGMDLCKKLLTFKTLKRS